MELTEKWAPVLDHESLGKITDAHKRAVTAVLLENTEQAIAQERGVLYEAAPTNSVGSYADTNGFAKFDPVLIALVRRSAPQLIAYDICGVQPLKQPTGLIFAMRSRYGAQNGTEAFYNEADSDYSGTGTHANTLGSGAETTGTGTTVANGEAFGSGTTFNEMSMSIEKVAVEAKTRALRAEYSLELAQDLKALHGLEAETELSNILSTEILAEINREIIRTVYMNAKAGAQTGNVTTPGTFDLDTDSNGRWSVERFKGLLFQLDREANQVARETRRGRANYIVCSSDVASALAAAGRLDVAGALKTDLNVDEANATYAGMLDGKFKIYIDPYAAGGATQYAVVGYKGSSAYDAGIFYCPYVPLQMVRAIDPATFAPKIGFKTRYGLVSNPFAQGTTVGAGALTANTNTYFRRVAIANLM